MNSESDRGCIMCDSLYVKANGEMPCWDDVGESRILRKLELPRLMNGEERELFSHSQLLHIRRSFMNHQFPYPDLCRFCAVRNHGPSSPAINPRSMHILHIEPSYLCHLSCPQCIPAASRKGLSAPPYNMPAAALEALLRQLLLEGIRYIGIVHFEGRGDPLMNPQLDKMVRITRDLYPFAETMITTHGSYPFKPWLVESGLSCLRVSIDGACPESYRKYRVGGDLGMALKFLECLRDERRRRGSPLKVYWKYILFEWNDSDEEIRHAEALAKQLDVSLVFVLTHSPGRSKRFASRIELQQALRLLAPAAGTETTFQLIRPGPPASHTLTEARIAALLHTAKKLIDENNERVAFGLIFEALDDDCGNRPENYAATRGLVRAYVPMLLQSGRYPSTLVSLAAIFFAWGDQELAIRLLKKYARTVTTMGRFERLLLTLRLYVRLRTRWRNGVAQVSRRIVGIGDLQNTP
jgi:wyosine [tRNA(Phe)-imidazoG37] synthetase (radical SAM superfamily)